MLFLCGIFFSCSLAFSYEGPTIEVTVAKNDYLINICKKYLEDSRRWRKIARINRLANPDLIYPGQRLVLPVDMLRGTPVDGKVTFIKGNAMTQEKGSEEWHPLHPGDPVKQGSGIRTAEESAVEITFEDGASFYLRPNSTLKINTASKKGFDHFMRQLYLQSGKTISRLKEATGSESRFEIHTPSAVAAARGTEFRVSVDDIEATRSEVLRGIIGVAAMKQSVEVNEGEGTLVRMNEPPLTPRKLLPAPDLIDMLPVYKSMPLKFHFKNIDGVSSYRITLARDANFKDVLRDVVIKPDESAEMSGMDDGGYFLQSTSIDADGLEGLPSDAVAVKVRVNPVPPFIQSPLAGAESREKSVEFKWLRVKDAVRYHLQIAEDKEFSKLVMDKADITDTAYTETLPGYKTYYYRVSSIADDGYEGASSDATSFSVVPPPPSLDKPKVDEKEIHISWRDMGDGITYHFQMAPDTEFRNIIVDEKIERPTITIQRPAKSGTYLVRTSSIDTKGHESDFSTPQSFEIKRGIRFGPLAIIGAAWLIILLVF